MGPIGTTIRLATRRGIDRWSWRKPDSLARPPRTAESPNPAVTFNVYCSAALFTFIAVRFVGWLISAAALGNEEAVVCGEIFMVQTEKIGKEETSDFKVSSES